MENKPQKLQRLTRKQKGFVRDFVRTDNGTLAALNNYDIESSKPEKVASVIATENLNKPSIIHAIEVKRKSLKQALIDEGITEQYLATKVNTLLKAVDKEGQVDYTAVDKGLKHATNIYGVEDIEKPTENVYNFFFDPTFQSSIKQYDENLKTQILKQHVDED